MDKRQKPSWPSVLASPVWVLANAFLQKELSCQVPFALFCVDLWNTDIIFCLFVTLLPKRTCNPSTWELKAEELVVHGHFWRHSELKASLTGKVLVLGDAILGR